MRDDRKPSGAMVKKFMEVNKIKEKVIGLMVSNIILSGSPALKIEKENIVKHVDINEFCRILSERAYSKYFNADDILDIISFYKSEAGQKMVKYYPELMADVIDETYQYSAKVAARIIIEEEATGV
jgi:hypothetical protein